MTIRQIKKELGISNKDIAEFFGYSNIDSYQNAARKKNIENGIIKLYEVFKRVAEKEKNNCR